MELAGTVVVVTGGGGGIGAALSRRFAAADCAAVVVADIDRDAAWGVSAEIVGTPEHLDVTDGDAVAEMVERTVRRLGRIDLYCANAGVATDLGLNASDDDWRTTFEINVMSHVHAARAVLPHMLQRGSGYFLATASAAGLLTSPGDAPYSATKHAAVGFAEWLAVMYGDRGIKVSVLCPMGVATPMLLNPLAAGGQSARIVAASGQILSPDQVADLTLDALAEEKFLILPHAEVGVLWARKAADPDRWLRGMRRLMSANEA